MVATQVPCSISLPPSLSPSTWLSTTSRSCPGRTPGARASIHTHIHTNKQTDQHRVTTQNAHVDLTGRADLVKLSQSTGILVSQSTQVPSFLQKRKWSQRCFDRQNSSHPEDQTRTASPCPSSSSTNKSLGLRLHFVSSTYPA